jgi:soluble P-type ATPase
MDYYLRFVADNKVSFDYDEVLSTEKGKELAKRKMSDGNTVYIISARRSIDGMINTAKAIGIPESRVYATGSNKAKVEKIKELGIQTHYDNNPDVINELGDVGKLFTNG